MSTLRSAIDELAGEELGPIADRVLLDVVVELSRDIAALHAQRLRRIAERKQSTSPHALGKARPVDQPRTI